MKSKVLKLLTCPKVYLKEILMNTLKQDKGLSTEPFQNFNGHYSLHRRKICSKLTLHFIKYHMVKSAQLENICNFSFPQNC